MVSPIKKTDLATQVIEELNQQLAVTEAMLVKVLEKTGTVEITVEELSRDVHPDIRIHIDLDDQKEVWTFGLTTDPVDDSKEL